MVWDVRGEGRGSDFDVHTALDRAARNLVMARLRHVFGDRVLGMDVVIVDSGFDCPSLEAMLGGDLSECGYYFDFAVYEGDKLLARFACTALRGWEKRDGTYAAEVAEAECFAVEDEVDKDFLRELVRAGEATVR